METTHSKEVIDRAGDMLVDMAKLVDDQPFNLSHSDFVTKMWKAFNKGKKYGEFVTEAKAKARHAASEVQVIMEYTEEVDKP